MIPLTADPAIYPCQAHAYHQPAPVWTHMHHPVPKAWTEALGMPEDDPIPICPHGHDAVHASLRKALRGETFTAGTVIRWLVGEAMRFYHAHPSLQSRLMALADEL